MSNIQEPQIAAVASESHVRTTTARRFAPDAIVAGLVGLLSLVIGLLVVVRAGIDAPLSDPVTSVLGFTHTATLGLIEVGLGLFLLLAASARSRGAAMFGGLAMVVAGVVGVAQYSSFRESLALEQGWAWIVLIAGIVVAGSSLLLRRSAMRSTVVEHQVV
jgi:hypothetical protein